MQSAARPRASLPRPLAGEGSGGGYRERQEATPSCPTPQAEEGTLWHRRYRPSALAENGYRPSHLSQENRLRASSSSPSHADIAEMAKKMAPSGFELVVSRADRAALEPVLPVAEYLVCRSPDDALQGAPKLRLYQLLSAGYDDVDLEAARRAKVPVCNNGGANAISVSEHAIMLMLAVSRRVIWQHGNVSAGRWRGNGPAPRDVRDRSTRRSASSGSAPSARRWRGSPARSACASSITTSRACRSTRRTRTASASGCCASFWRTLRYRDLHVPLNDSTRHMIGASELALMKPDGGDRQHQPRPGDRRGGADQRARRPQDLRRGPRRVRPGAAAAGQSAVQARQRAADLAFRGTDLGQSHARLRNAFDNIQRVARGEKPLWVVPELAELVTE